LQKSCAPLAAAWRTIDPALAMFSAAIGVQANWVAATVTFIAGSGA
jgi:hypothetical protein